MKVGNARVRGEGHLQPRRLVRLDPRGSRCYIAGAFAELEREIIRER